MDLQTPVMVVPGVSFDPARHATPGQLAMIDMLSARGSITVRDAERLAHNPSALDDVVMLSLLRDRHDLTDMEYEFEKGEIIRQVYPAQV
jgi:hypothetical protein